MDFTNIAVLKPYVPIFDHQRVRVLTLLQEFEYDASSVESDDGITVITPPSGVGRWLRDLAPVPTWTAKDVWYQDSVTGDDEYAGTAARPVRTLREITRRLRRVDARVYKIYQLSDVLPTDSVRFAPELSAEGNGFTSRQIVASILISGELAVKVDSSGILGAATTNTNASANTQATVQGPTPWASKVGRLLRVTDAAGKVAQAVVLKEIASGVARVSEWVDPAKGTPALTIPVPGDTYQIMSLPTFAAPILYAGLTSKVSLEFQDVLVSSARVIPSACTTVFTSCVFKVALIGPPTGFPFDCFIRACAVYFATPTDFTQTGLGNGPRYTGCGLVNARIQISTYGRTTTSNTVMQGGHIRVIDKSKVFGGLMVATDKLGIFGSAESAVVLRRGMVMQVQENAQLYGAENALFGVEVMEGASLVVHDTVNPKITGAKGDVQLEQAKKAIPELVENALVPAAKELRLWTAHWITGFARNVVSYKTGARIISVKG